MGNIVAIVVGIAAFGVVSIAGSPVGAVLFGLLMYGMAYGAFAWKPGQPKQNNVESSMGNQVTPEQIGAALGASLVAGHDPANVEEKERSIVQAAGVPLDRYVIERFVLNACAAAFAIERSVPPAHRACVLAGLESSLTEVAAPYPALRGCARTFSERLSTYGQAAKVDGSSEPDDEAVSVSTISGVFGDALASHASSTAASEGMCQVLAMAVGDAHWAGRVQGSGIFLQRAVSLLKRNA